MLGKDRAKVHWWSHINRHEAAHVESAEPPCSRCCAHVEEKLAGAHWARAKLCGRGAALLVMGFPEEVGFIDG